MNRLLISLPLLLALPACANMQMSRGKGLCKEEQMVRFMGQKADSDTGRRMLFASGAHEMRWAPPRTAMTMEHKDGRLTVGYDDDMMVTSAHCG